MEKKTKTLITIIVSILFIMFLWYALSPLFIDKVVDEEMPASLDNSEISSKQLYSGDFTDGDSFHKVSGDAKIITDGSGKKYLRFENFESTNGPDLYVYISTDKGNEDFVSLGKLKGNIGDQNYELPENVDLEKYDNVLIWCQRFSVLFGSAEINGESL